MLEIKNVLKSKLLVIFLAATFVCLTPSFTLAAEGDTTWYVENFGVFQTPAKWQAVKYEEVLDRLEKVLEKVLKQSTNVKPKTTDVAPTMNTDKVMTDISNAKNFFVKMFKENNISSYQVTMEANKSYYISDLTFYKERRPMTENEAVYFNEKTTGKNRQEFAAMMTMMQSEVINFQQTVPWKNYDLDVKILPDGSVEYLTVKNTPAYGIGTRVIINMFGVNVPYYVKIYVLNLDGYRTYAVLGCLDSERAFWDKTFKPIVSSLK